MKRRHFLELIGGSAVSLVPGCGGGGGDSGSGTTNEPFGDACIQTISDRPNVLFISIDDLNDWVGVLGGHPQARTPHIDALASRGVLFDNAHCNAPICRPSRTSTLYGLRPTTTGLYKNSNRPLWAYDPALVHLPNHFRQNGYRTIGAGKIIEGPNPEYWDDYWPGYFLLQSSDPVPPNRPLTGLADTGQPPVDWGPLPDDADPLGDQRLVTEFAAPLLQDECLPEPFFLAVGFFKPHLPWYLPADAFAGFPGDEIVTPEVLANDIDDLPNAGRRIINQRPLEVIDSAGRWSDAVGAYLAAVNFVDGLVGDLVSALDASEHANDTIIVLWSDNGFHMGEKQHWHKKTLWHESTRVPLIVVQPGDENAGAVCSRTVSLLDIYPTLIELCDLTDRPGLEGNSLAPLLADAAADWPIPAVVTRDLGEHAVITEDWRYISYGSGEEELYDLRDDRNEWTNLADRPDTDEVRAELASWLPANEAEPLTEADEVASG